MDANLKEKLLTAGGVAGGLVGIVVLLNIFTICCGPPRPADYLRGEVKEIVSIGVGFTVPYAFEFAKGDVLIRKQIIAGSGILEEDFALICLDKTICGADKPLGVADSVDGNKRAGIGGILKAESKTKATLVVCGNSGRSQPPRYCASAAQSADKASNDCADTCDVK